MCQQGATWAPWMESNPPTNEKPEPRQHVTDGSVCWCNPTLTYKDPDTGAEVWVHQEPQ